MVGVVAVVEFEDALRRARVLDMEALRASCLSLGANAVGSRDALVAALATRLTVALPDGAHSPTVLESNSGEEEPAPRGDPSDEAASLIQLRSGAQLSARLPSPPTLVIETSAFRGFDAAVQPTASLPSPPPLVAYGRGGVCRNTAQDTGAC